MTIFKVYLNLKYQTFLLKLLKVLETSHATDNRMDLKAIWVDVKPIYLLYIVCV